MKLTKEEKSWILYDVANSAFVLIIVTTVMPIFFKDIASKGVADAVSTGNWAFANSLASLLLAFMAPIMGVFADYKLFKKRFLMGFLSLGILFTLLLTTVNEGDWLSCLIIFIFARVGFSGANLFYDAFLIDVTEKKRMDWISSCGFAWGYIGGAVPFVAVIAVIIIGMSSGTSSAISIGSAKIAFVIVALWWLGFSFPILKNVSQVHFIEPAEHPIKDSFIRLFKTFREIQKYKNAFLFLIAYFFYIDGVDTIITMATAYGRDIGLGITMLILVVLMIQVVAFPFALVYGKLAKKYSTKAMLFIGIGVYTLITLISFFLPALPTLQMKVLVFWVLAFLVATSQGGIQALSRSYFGKLIPVEHAGEFFGFYNIFGKFAAITGPFLMGLITRITGHSRFGILSIIVLFIVGGIFLIKVDREP